MRILLTAGGAGPGRAAASRGVDQPKRGAIARAVHVGVGVGAGGEVGVRGVKKLINEPVGEIGRHKMRDRRTAQREPAHQYLDFARPRIVVPAGGDDVVRDCVAPHGGHGGGADVVAVHQRISGTGEFPIAA